MVLVAAMTGLSVILGAALPVRWRIFGFLGAAAFLFLVQFLVNAASGFAGSSIEDSLLLFNGSYLAYLGFNLQITYRAFAGPLLALAATFIFRVRH